MSEVIKRDQYGYKIYPLLDGSEVLWAEEERVLFHRASPESMPLTTDADGVFEDLLGLIDSLQQKVYDQVQKIHMLNVANNIQKDTAVDWGKLVDRVTAERDALHDQIVERDRTIDLLTEQMKGLEKFPRETEGTGDHVLDFDYLHMIKLEIGYEDRDFSTLGADDIEDVLLAVERVREEQRAKALGRE